MYVLCKKFGTMCRYCSDENKTEIKRDLVITPDKKGAVRREEIKTPLGQFCNNVSEWVDKLAVCPRIEAMGAELVQRKESELDWSRRHGGC